MASTASLLIWENIGTGRENATSSERLQQISGLCERDLRKTIEQLRRSGRVIISAVDGGYYKPANTAELKRFIHKEKTFTMFISVLTTLKSAKQLLKEWDGETVD